MRFAAGGLGPPLALGYDMSSALSLASAMEIAPSAVAELLPIIENFAVQAINEASDG